MIYSPPICPPQSEAPEDVGSRLFNKLWWLFFRAIAFVLQHPLVRQGTRADRLALGTFDVFDATLFTETDTGLVYQVRTVNTVSAWYYVAGTYALAQAGIVAFTATLGPTDAGLLLASTDYFHAYRWDGAALKFAPGDPGSDFIAAGAPAGGLWGACNGSTYAVAQPNGSLANVATPDLTGDVFLKGAAAQGTQEAATRPIWEAGAKTDDEAAHTHDVLIPGTAVASGTGTPANVAVPGVYTTGAGTAHHHDLSDANAQLKVTGDSDSGLPLRIALAWFLRR